jgi:chemotaxis protein CheC
MVLTERQDDALTELINISFARTASSLSDLTGERVMLDAPQVSIRMINELYSTLAEFVQGDVATVHQIFTGPVSGDALLLLNYEGAIVLTNLLTNGSSSATRLDESAREVLTEVGNILLNACLGVFGNLLQVQVSFSVPRLQLESLNSVLKSLVIGNEGMRYAMVVYTAFRMHDSEVKGYLIIVLGVSSLDRLIQEVENWEEKQ